MGIDGPTHSPSPIQQAISSISNFIPGVPVNPLPPTVIPQSPLTSMASAQIPQIPPVSQFPVQLPLLDSGSNPSPLFMQSLFPEMGMVSPTMLTSPQGGYTSPQTILTTNSSNSNSNNSRGFTSNML